MKLKGKYPDKHGYFGRYGGRFVPETLMSALEELERNYRKISRDREFKDKYRQLLSEYGGRPTPLYFASRLSEKLRARIYLKREDLLFTGAHKLNNTLGQALLAERMGKRRLIAETGAGQHGVATATVAAMLGMQCRVYMGSTDMERQKLNVFRMRLLGTEVYPVVSGSKTLKDAINEAMRDWVANVETTHYLLGSVVGPHPYPMIVRDFQRVIGEETKKQSVSRDGKLPDAVVACVGGGSNSMGIFYEFLDDNVALIGVEAGGKGIKSGEHGASLAAGREGILHGSRSLVLQDKNGQIAPTHSVSAGLDYPGVGPELSFLKSIGRIKCVTASDKEALGAFTLLSKTEGIVPALESAHALAYVVKNASSFRGKSVVINLSGRGDKDVEVAAEETGVEI